jgi:hypothetical protein
MFWNKTRPTPDGEIMLDGAAIAAAWPCASLMAPMFIPEIDTADRGRLAANELPRDG